MNEKELEAMQQAEQMKQMEEMKKKLLARILTREAFERLSRVRSAHPQVAQQAELYLLQIAQQGKLGEPVTDQQMKDILKALSEKKDFQITRR